jgi:hypothetical protein
MSDTHGPGSPRDTVLPALLGGILAVFFLTFLVVVTGGIFFWVALVVGGIVLFGWFHYWLWGKALTERTAGEREEAELFERARGEEPEVRRAYRK